MRKLIKEQYYILQDLPRKTTRIINGHTVICVDDYTSEEDGCYKVFQIDGQFWKVPGWWSSDNGTNYEWSDSFMVVGREVMITQWDPAPEKEQDKIELARLAQKLNAKIIYEN